MNHLKNVDTGLCLAVGAGAIGKSISGYVFSQLGYKVVFADVMVNVIEDINHRNGYNIIVAEGGKDNIKQAISGITAVNVNDEAATVLALEADYICTSIGTNGFNALLPLITGWIKERNKKDKKKLYILLFENDTLCKQLLTNSIIEALGHFPEWLKIVKTSIERMTKPTINNGTEFDVIAEKFIPVIAPIEQLAGSSIDGLDHYFELVENVEAYYYRKLYTNNLGHAVLGYMGSFYGYETTTQAMDNPIITNTLKGVLSEAGNMLKCKYGFTESQMNTHIDELITRYKNEGMDDSLKRLSRDPMRKLGHGERIVGAILRCIECGIFPNEIIKVLFYTVNYMDLDDKSACKLSEILNEGGMEAVLTDICEIQRNDEPFEAICKLYTNFEYRKVRVLL